jgi:hypothetical protein
MDVYQLIPVKNAGYAKVSPEDFERASHRRWYAVKRGRKVPTLYAESAAHPQVLMHRFIVDCPKGFVVDHINGDGLDNRRSNLRICSQRENSRNRVGANGYCGVSWKADCGRWRARIMVDRREISLGVFDTPEQAAEAYNRAAIKHYGQFAKLNVFGPAPQQREASRAA